MTFKKYFYCTILFSLAIILCIVSFNVYMNGYGLFGDVKEKFIILWHNERTSKYLFSYNYIPSNFEGILIGSSVSDNLNTKKISKFKVYNASINGGNVSELKYIADNVIQRGNLKFIIFCLHRYMTRDNGRKTSYMHPQEYWSALGSKETVMMYTEMILVKFGLKTSIYNEYGFNNFNLHWEKPVKQTPATFYKNTQAMVNPTDNENYKIKFQPEYIDEVAYNELADIIKLARERKIQLFAFYYPFYVGKYNRERFNSYKDRIDKLFTNQDCVWNFNSDEYVEFRNDMSNYYDRTHLSWKGADFIISEINDRVTKSLSPPLHFNH